MKYDPQIPLGLNLYVLTHFALTLVLAVNVLTLADQNSPLGSIVAPVLMVLWALVNLGGILERRGWSPASETLRLLALPAVVAWLTSGVWLWTAVGASSALAAVSMVWLLGYRAQFSGDRPSVAQRRHHQRLSAPRKSILAPPASAASLRFTHIRRISVPGVRQSDSACYNFGVGPRISVHASETTRHRRRGAEVEPVRPAAAFAMETRAMQLLTINTGSSSLKIAVYQFGAAESCVLTAQADQIGLKSGASKSPMPLGPCSGNKTPPYPTMTLP